MTDRTASIPAPPAGKGLDEGRRDLFAAIRRAARQEQFLEVVAAAEAQARFARHLELTPRSGETVARASSSR